MISNSSPAFKYWLDPPAKVYRKYYLFDVKNSKEIQEGKEKPILPLVLVWQRTLLKLICPGVY